MICYLHVRMHPYMVCNGLLRIIPLHDVTQVVHILLPSVLHHIPFHLLYHYIRCILTCAACSIDTGVVVWCSSSGDVVMVYSS